MNFEQLTIGELRRVLVGGENEQTVSEALAALDVADAAAAEHAESVRAYQAHVRAREAALRASVIAAVDGVDEARRRDGHAWPSAEARAEKKRRAGLEAEHAFDWPLFTYQDWLAHGKPVSHPENPVARRLAKIDRLAR
jgi:hypothetical protein